MLTHVIRIFEHLEELNQKIHPIKIIEYDLENPKDLLIQYTLNKIFNKKPLVFKI